MGVQEDRMKKIGHYRGALLGLAKAWPPETLSEHLWRECHSALSLPSKT